MRTLTIVNALFAFGFILAGLIAIFGVGITGALILIPGIVFGALAAVSDTKSRMAVTLALTVDGAVAYYAFKQLQTALNPKSTMGWLKTGERVFIKPNIFDYLIPSAVLALVACAVIAVLLDWRSFRTASWW